MDGTEEGEEEDRTSRPLERTLLAASHLPLAEDSSEESGGELDPWVSQQNSGRFQEEGRLYMMQPNFSLPAAARPTKDPHSRYHLRGREPPAAPLAAKGTGGKPKKGIKTPSLEIGSQGRPSSEDRLRTEDLGREQAGLSSIFRPANLTLRESALPRGPDHFNENFRSGSPPFNARAESTHLSQGSSEDEDDPLSQTMKPLVPKHTLAGGTNQNDSQLFHNPPSHLSQTLPILTPASSANQVYNAAHLLGNFDPYKSPVRGQGSRQVAFRVGQEEAEEGAVGLQVMESGLGLQKDQIWGESEKERNRRAKENGSENSRVAGGGRAKRSGWEGGGGEGTDASRMDEQTRVTVGGAELSALASSIEKLASQVAGAMMNQPRKEDAGMPKAPSFQLIPLTLGPNGTLDAVTYHTWKIRLQHQIQALKIGPDVVLHMLLTRPNLLPAHLRNQMLNCLSLSQLLDRLDNQSPHLSSALPTLKERITSLPPSGTSGKQIEDRCTALMGALEDLATLFPSYELGREEVLACLDRIGGSEILSQVHFLLGKWCRKAATKERTMNESLYQFLQTIRSNRIELRVASEIYHKKPIKPQLLFEQEEKRVTKGAKKPEPEKGKTPAGRKSGLKDWSESICSVCKKKHRMARFDCPKLKDIADKKASLPDGLCKKCLGPSDANKRCLSANQPCWESRARSDGVKFNFLCKQHPFVHFKACNQHPPGFPRLLENQKIQLMFSRKQAAAKPKTPEGGSSFLVLDSLSEGEVMLETTLGLCEVIECYHPGQKKYVKAYAQYDSGGSLSLVEKGEGLDLNQTEQVSEAVVLSGLDGQSQGHLPIFLIRMKSIRGPLDVSFCSKSFPTEPPDPQITQILFKGETLKIPSEEELRSMPKLLIGQRLMRLHPEPIPDSQIPPSFAAAWPGIQPFRSRVTGGLLFSGHLALAGPAGSNQTILKIHHTKRPGGESKSHWEEKEKSFSNRKEAKVKEKEKKEEKAAKDALKEPQPTVQKEEAPDAVAAPAVELVEMVEKMKVEEKEKVAEAEKGKLEKTRMKGEECKKAMETGTRSKEERKSGEVETGPMLVVGRMQRETNETREEGKSSKETEETRPPRWPPPLEIPSIVAEEASQELFLSKLCWTQNVAELMACCGPGPSSTLAGRLGTEGCLRCNPLSKGLAEMEANDHLLASQLSWQPLEQGKVGGFFVLERLHNNKIDSLPSGAGPAAAMTRSLIRRLETLPKTRQYVSYKLEEEYKLGMNRWVAAEELETTKEKCHFLAPLLVVNLRSLTSPGRLCQNPATKHRVENLTSSVKTLSFNDTLYQYGGSLITPEQFCLYQNTALQLTGADIKAAFRCLRMQVTSQMKCLTYRLKSKQGYPTLDPSLCESDKLFCLAENVCSFGQSDLPHILGAALKLAPDMFHAHAPSSERQKISPIIFSQISVLLRLLVYLDDLPLISSFRHLLQHQQEQNGPLCQWVTEGEMAGFAMSEKDWSEYQRVLADAVRDHQKALIRGTLRILSFSSFYTKSVDGSDKEISSIHTTHETEFPSPKVSVSIKKPLPSEIFEENGGAGEIELGKGEEPFLSQLGKKIYKNRASNLPWDDMESSKNHHLIFSKLKKYTFSGEIRNYTQFEDFLKRHQGKITRRLTISILAQLWDPRGRFLIVPTILLKFAMHNFYKYVDSERGEKGLSESKIIGWEEEVPQQTKPYIHAAVRAFFLLCRTQRPRCEIIFHTAAIRILLLMSDTSPAMGATQAYLISGLTIGNVYKGKVHLLSQQVNLNRPSEASLPFLELYFLWKNINKNLPLLPWLASQGLGVPKHHVIIAADSSSALLQLKSSCYNQFQLRINHLCSKAASCLIAQGLDPLSSLYFFDQHQDKAHFHFPSDLASKPPKNLSDDNLVRWHQKINEPKWMSQHPVTWTHLKRNIFLPKSLNRAFLDNLKVNPEHLERVARKLEELRQIRGAVLREGGRLPDLHRPILGFQSAKTNIKWVKSVVERRQRVLNSRGGGAVAVLAKVLFFAYKWKFLCKLPPFTKAELRKQRSDSYLSWINSPHLSRFCGQVGCGSSEAGCSQPKSTFGGRPTSNRPHLAFPQNLCCNNCKISGKANKWGSTNDTSEALSCADCVAKQCIAGPPLNCDGNICEENCNVYQSPSYLDFTQEFNQTHPPLASGSQIHQRNFYLGRILTHFSFDESRLAPFLELALDLVAASEFPNNNAHQNIYGWSIYETKVFQEQKMAFGLSREHRNRATPLTERGCGRVVVRIVNPDSDLAKLLIRDIHEFNRCAAVNTLDYHLIRSGIYFAGAKQQLKVFAKTCHICNVRKGRRNQTRDLIRQDWAGPTEELPTLFANVSPHSHVQIDYAGPFWVVMGGQYIKRWALIAVQTLLRRAILIPVRSLSAADLLQSLLVLACREGNLSFCHSDPASNTRPWATRSNQMNPAEDTEKVKQDFASNPWISLCTDFAARKLRERGCVFRLSGVARSHVQAEAERIVGELKSFLAQNQDHFSNHQSIDDFDFTYLLDKVALFCNSRPLAANSHLALTAHDLVTAAGRAGPYSGGSGLSLSPFSTDSEESGPVKERDRLRNIQADCDKLQNITHFLHQQLAYFFLPRLKNVLQPTSYKHRRGPSVESLQVGDVCIDSDYVSKHGSCCGALARIILLSDGNRMALLVRLKRKFLHNNAYLDHTKGISCLSNHHQPCQACKITPLSSNHLEVICRDSQDLYWVATSSDTKDQRGNEMTAPHDDPRYNDVHLCGPPLPPTPSPRYLLPDPAEIQKVKFGSVIPPISPGLLQKYGNLDLKQWEMFRGEGKGCEVDQIGPETPAHPPANLPQARPRRKRRQPDLYGDFIKH